MEFGNIARIEICSGDSGAYTQYAGEYVPSPADYYPDRYEEVSRGEMKTARWCYNLSKFRVCIYRGIEGSVGDETIKRIERWLTEIGNVKAVVNEVVGWAIKEDMFRGDVESEQIRKIMQKYYRDRGTAKGLEGEYRFLRRLLGDLMDSIIGRRYVGSRGGADKCLPDAGPR